MLSHVSLPSPLTWEFADIMVDEDVVTLCVSWSADRLNARAYHAAACATFGAAGFLVSALLPATSLKASPANVCMSQTGINFALSLDTAVSLSQLLEPLAVFPHCSAGYPQTFTAPPPPALR